MVVPCVPCLKTDCKVTKNKRTPQPQKIFFLLFLLFIVICKQKQKSKLYKVSKFFAKKVKKNLQSYFFVVPLYQRNKKQKAMIQYKEHTEKTITLEISAGDFYNLMQAVRIANDAILEQMKEDAKTPEDAIFYANSMQLYNDILGRMIKARKDAKTMII